MPDIGWMELMVIGIVALIVVGPKDLPVMFRKAGLFVGRIKGMAREFTSAMNDAADQTGMREMNREMKALTNPRQYGLDKVKQSLNADLDLDADFNSDKPLKTGNQGKPAGAQGNPTQAPAPAVKRSEPAEAPSEVPAQAKAAPAKKTAPKAKAAPKATPKKAPVKKAEPAKTTRAKAAPAKAKTTAPKAAPKPRAKKADEA
ncbi:MAG: twin-arginine translocase subunit TatB [Rhodobacteraceae bacterium]|jgi:sec-independent protein translocase protein TatB|uniref:Sec-independent protein translocase protein TatB n=1 Tax=Roseovarius sp. 10 TaxID=3080563 RepID=UPI001937B88B|nr:Sec-independent protein translocase protein TatB [Roseovarius sp. 10]MBE1290467.1 twin-arginine translocase subunit TatB [Paracoccaceae bacterium]MDV7201237.1 Sec-independent protein translocase protein TatB [Roseovarius sp. 10]QPI86304.1 twin-arginine translocase subunit TatB [Rhodobacterales bacterium HKCCA1288]